MSQLERILQRQPHVDAAELEGVRARSKARLEAISVPTRREVPVPIEVMDVNVDVEAVDDLDDTVGHGVAEDILAVEAEDDASVADEPLAEAADADPHVSSEPAGADPDEALDDTPDADRWFAVGPGQPTEGSSDDQPVPDESPDESFDDSSPLALSGPTSDWIQPEGLWDPLVQVASEYDETRAELAETTAHRNGGVRDRPADAGRTAHRTADRRGPDRGRGSRHRSHAGRPARPRRSGTRSRPRVVATAYCPYCAAHLDPPPTTDRRCARCRQRIVVRSIEGGVLVYLTEASIRVFDAEREREANLERWAGERRRWLVLARAAGAPPSRVDRFERATASEDAVEAARAFFGTTVDHAVDDALRRDLWEVAAGLRRDQARAIHQIAGRPLPVGDDITELVREAALIELRGMGTMMRNAALVAGRCCEACRAEDGVVVRISTELRRARLPHAACAKAPCRCRWDLAPRDVRTVQRYLERTGRWSGTRPADHGGTDPEVHAEAH